MIHQVLIIICEIISYIITSEIAGIDASQIHIKHTFQALPTQVSSVVNN